MQSLRIPNPNPNSDLWHFKLKICDPALGNVLIFLNLIVFGLVAHESYLEGRTSETRLLRRQHNKYQFQVLMQYKYILQLVQLEGHPKNAYLRHIFSCVC